MWGEGKYNERGRIKKWGRVEEGEVWGDWKDNERGRIRKWIRSDEGEGWKTGNERGGSREEWYR